MFLTSKQNDKKIVDGNEKSPGESHVFKNLTNA